VVFALITVFSVKVLATVDQRKPNTAGQPWYQKGWRATTSGENTDSSEAGGGRMRTRPGGDGSGAGQISDLDEGASGLGEDDEDTEEMGSGTGSSASRFDIGSSGDYSLPPTVGYPSSLAPTKVTSIDTVQLSTAVSSPIPKAIPTTEKVTATPLYTIHEISETSSTVTEIAIRKVTTMPTVSTTETTATERRTSATPVIITTPHSSTAPTSTTTMAPKKEKPSVLDDNRNKTLSSNFWMRPGVLAGLIGGAIAGLLAAILLVMFVVYRMRKKDEGSYALEEPKSPPTYAYAYQKAPTREFYA